MEWISVKERMPEKSCGYLCHVIIPNNGESFEDIKIIRYNIYNKCWLCKSNDGIITHWMPLPDLPKEIII